MTERTSGAWSKTKEIWGRVKRIREEETGMVEDQKNSRGTSRNGGKSKGFGRN
jgi:hypothetical protein